jgi:hypothetical protein
MYRGSKSLSSPGCVCEQTPSPSQKPPQFIASASGIGSCGTAAGQPNMATPDVLYSTRLKGGTRDLNIDKHVDSPPSL